MLAQLHGQQRDPASEEHPLPDHEQHEECEPASAEHPLADHEEDEQGGELPLPDYEKMNNVVIHLMNTMATNVNMPLLYLFMTLLIFTQLKSIAFTECKN